MQDGNPILRATNVPGCLYFAEAQQAPDYAPLTENVSVRAAIVGGGFTGLSTALHLREAGVEAAVIEAKVPGWGASGRNGGQVNAGLKREPADVLDAFGAKRGERLVRLSGDAPGYVFELIGRHGIDCDADRAGSIRVVRTTAETPLVEASIGAWGGARRRAGVPGPHGAPKARRDRHLSIRPPRPAGRQRQSAGLRARACEGGRAARRQGVLAHAGDRARTARRPLAHQDAAWGRRGGLGCPRDQWIHRRAVARTPPDGRSGIQRHRGHRPPARAAPPKDPTGPAGRLRELLADPLFPGRCPWPAAHGRTEHAAAEPRAGPPPAPHCARGKDVPGPQGHGLAAFLERAGGCLPRPLSAPARAGAGLDRGARLQRTRHRHGDRHGADREPPHPRGAPAEELELPISPLKPFPLHRFWRPVVEAAQLRYTLLDKLRRIA